MDCWRNRTALAAVVVVMGISLHAHGADLPAEIRTASDARQHSGIIDKFIKDQLGKLTDPANARPVQARDELCRQVEGGQGGTGIVPSSSFKQVYVDTIKNNLSLLTEQDAGTRVNAGVIVHRLAVATGALQLEETAVKLLADESPAVALWGIKAGGALLPSILSVPFNANKEQITKGIVDAVKKHPNVGPIVQEAYTALDVSAVKPALPPIMIAKCVDATLAVMRHRIGLWTNGVPVDPHAESAAILFLTKGDVLAAVKKQPRAQQQKLDIAQHVMDLLIVSARRANLSSAADRGRLYTAATVPASGGMYVLMAGDGNKPAADAFAGLTKLPGSMTPAQVENAITLAIGAVRSVPAYQTLKDAPTVQQAKAE